MKKLCMEVLEHLKEDSEKWFKLSTLASDEYLSDIKLMEKIREVS